LTIVKDLMGTQLAAYHELWMSAARVRVIFRTSSAIETLTTRSRIVAKRETDSSTSTVMKWTMISMTLTMTSPPDIALRMEGAMKEESGFPP
jgi:hypothetical protein